MYTKIQIVHIYKWRNFLPRRFLKNLKLILNLDLRNIDLNIYFNVLYIMLLLIFYCNLMKCELYCGSLLWFVCAFKVFIGKKTDFLINCKFRRLQKICHFFKRRWKKTKFSIRHEVLKNNKPFEYDVWYFMRKKMNEVRQY